MDWNLEFFKDKDLKISHVPVEKNRTETQNLDRKLKASGFRKARANNIEKKYEK